MKTVACGVCEQYNPRLMVCEKCDACRDEPGKHRADVFAAGGCTGFERLAEWIPQTQDGCLWYLQNSNGKVLEEARF